MSSRVAHTPESAFNHAVRLLNVRGGMWSRRIGRLDSLVVALSGVLAAITVWAGSYPVTDAAVLLVLMFGWPIVALLWSVTLFRSVADPVARQAALGLFSGSVVALWPGLTLLVVAFTGRLGIALGGLVAVALFAVVIIRSTERRIVWLVAPALVALTLGLLLTGAPRLARMAVAEPALTAYAEEILHRGPVADQRSRWFDPPIEVGSIPIHEVFIEDGNVHLVTGYSGLMLDSEGGLAYAPSGVSDPSYQHLLGAWYRWTWWD